jgi:hypothetical protein
MFSLHFQFPSPTDNKEINSEKQLTEGKDTQGKDAGTQKG